MKAYIFYGNQKLLLEDIPEPSVRSGFVKVKVAYCGICGSDVYRYYGPIKVNEPHPITGEKEPLAMGHEVSGIIDEVGECVVGLKPGDRVVIQPVIYCGKCRACREKQYSKCEQFGVLGWSSGGGLGKYICVPAHNVFKISDDLSLLDASLIQTGAFAYCAVLESGISVGNTCLVMEANACGLMAVQAAKHIGTSKIIVVDSSRARLRIAKEMGATHTIHHHCDDLKAEIMETAGPVGVDYIFDTICSESSINAALGCLSFDGTAVLMLNETGMLDDFTIHYAEFIQKPVNIKVAISPYVNRFAEMIELAEKRIIDTKPIITSIIPFDQVKEQEAEIFKLNGGNVRSVIKVNDLGE